MPRGMPYNQDARRSGKQSVKKGDDRMEDIKVLFIANSQQQSVHKIQNCKEADVVSRVLSRVEVLKHAMGNRMIERSMMNVSAAYSSLPNKKLYVLDVKTPTVRAEIHMSRADAASPHDYIIEMQSVEVKPADFSIYGKLLYSNKFSDVTLCVEGRNIFAHKIVLANKSPVFDVMLGNAVGKFEITDSTYDTFIDMLHYIYKGHIIDCDSDNILGKYSNLMKTDDIYCVDNLKELCEMKLSFILTTNNVLQCLVLADLHNALVLKRRAIDFIVENAKAILEMPFYQNFTKMHSALAASIWKI